MTQVNSVKLLNKRFSHTPIVVSTTFNVCGLLVPFLFFDLTGCDSVMQLSELGLHALDCPHKPTGELDAKVKMKDEAEFSDCYRP